jgi:hypothetical protein
MPLHPSSLRRFVRRALVDTAGVADPDRPRLAAAFDALCQRLRNQLDPLFGTAAVGALFMRSVHVATIEHPWLGELVPNAKNVCAVERVAVLDNLQVSGLDEMLGGGTLRGNGMLVAGPVGSGKSTVATQFVAEGVRRGEPGVVVIFEETTPKYLDQAGSSTSLRSNASSRNFTRCPECA